MKPKTARMNSYYGLQSSKETDKLRQKSSPHCRITCTDKIDISLKERKDKDNKKVQNDTLIGRCKSMR